MRAQWIVATGICLVAAASSYSAAAQTTDAGTVDVSPRAVAPRARVVVSGSAPCARVEIGVTPGALAVGIIEPVHTIVTEGRYRAEVMLPALTADPSRPGLYDTLTFHVGCAFDDRVVGRATVTTTLPGTGGVDPTTWQFGVAMLATGLLLSAGTARRRASG